jgi:hypothetical protein
MYDHLNLKNHVTIARTYVIITILDRVMEKSRIILYNDILSFQLIVHVIVLLCQNWLDNFQ